MKSLKDMVSLPDNVLHHYVAEQSEGTPAKHMLQEMDNREESQTRSLDPQVGDITNIINWKNRMILKAEVTWTSGWHLCFKVGDEEHLVSKSDTLSNDLADLMVAERKAIFVTNFKELRL